MFDWLNSNQFLSGGLVLMILGGALMWLRGVPQKLYDFFERWFIIRMEILDEDESYQWMQIWLAERLAKTLSISVITKRNKSENNYYDDNPAVNEDDHKPKVYFVPAVGTYFFWYKRRFVTLTRDRKENSNSTMPIMGSSDKSNQMRPRESFTLRIFSRNKELAKQLVEECRQKALPEDGKIDIRVGTYSYWSLGARIKPRSLSSVILEGTMAQDLLKDIKDFQASQAWYEDVGVPWRRSYLLEGPPGNGKTSIVKAIAGELNMHIYFLMLSDPTMTDARFVDLLTKIGQRSLLLLEDIDCAFNKRTRQGSDDRLTFSGLLNGIDGVASTEGRIIFMTTNHKERLDPALIRPGRADVHLHIGNATGDQAKRLFERFYPKEKHLASDFGLLVPDHAYSMAALQNYLMLHRAYPLNALRNIEDLKQIMVNSQPIEPPEQPQEPDPQSDLGELAD